MEGEGEFDEEGGEGMEGLPGGMDPAMMAQVAQLLTTMTPEQRGAMAAQFGMTGEQLQQLAAMAAMSGMLGGGAGPGGRPAGPGGAAPGGVVRISLSPAEQESVARLEAMGFPRNAVIQVRAAADDAALALGSARRVFPTAACVRSTLCSTPPVLTPTRRRTSRATRTRRRPPTTCWSTALSEARSARELRLHRACFGIF